MPCLTKQDLSWGPIADSIGLPEYQMKYQPPHLDPVIANAEEFVHIKQEDEQVEELHGLFRKEVGGMQAFVELSCGLSLLHLEPWR